MSKLTLHVPEELVAAAKREAAARRVSVSKLVSDFFFVLSSGKASGEDPLRDLAPRTRRLAKCLPEADGEDYVEKKVAGAEGKNRRKNRKRILTPVIQTEWHPCLAGTLENIECPSLQSPSDSFLGRAAGKRLIFANRNQRTENPQTSPLIRHARSRKE